MNPANGSADPRVISGINRAIDLAAQGEAVPAVQCLQSLLVEFPNVPSLHGYLAWFLSQIERHSEAIDESRRATSLSPQSETGSLIHFHVLWRAGKCIDALEEMRRFLAIRSCEEYMKIVRGWEASIRDETDVKRVISEIEEDMRHEKGNAHYRCVARPEFLDHLG
jgi:hypothetical protein